MTSSLTAFVLNKLIWLLLVGLTPTSLYGVVRLLHQELLVLRGQIRVGRCLLVVDHSRWLLDRRITIRLLRLDGAPRARKLIVLLFLLPRFHRVTLPIAA